MDARDGMTTTPGRGTAAVAALALGLALGALCLAAPPAAAQSDPWRGDLEVDLALGSLEDPSLIRVLTEDPEPRRRLERGQPFNQQPPAAQNDFELPEGATRVPGTNEPD